MIVREWAYGWEYGKQLHRESCRDSTDPEPVNGQLLQLHDADSLHLAKVEVEGSNPFSRSIEPRVMAGFSFSLVTTQPRVRRRAYGLGVRLRPFSPC